jgi:hypothetical protein
LHGTGAYVKWHTSAANGAAENEKEDTMAYEFQGISYSSSRDALKAIATAWVYGSAAEPYPETLAADPAALAAECVAEWNLGEQIAEWGEDAQTLAGAMARVLANARR